MDKNVKRMFFVLTLFTLLLAISTVSATDDIDDTGVITDTPADVTSEVVSEQSTVSDNDVINTGNEYKKETPNRGATSSITTTHSVSVDSLDDLTTIDDDTTYDIITDLTLGTITATNKQNVIFTSTTGAKLTNSAFALSGTNLQISNLEFENTNTNYPITITGSTNVIVNDNIVTYRKETSGDTFGIYVAMSDYVTVTENQVNVTAYPQEMNWFPIPEDAEEPDYYGAPQISGILLNNTNHTDVTYNIVNVNSTSPTVDHTMASTFDGIAILNNSQYDNINYNTVNVNGSEYMYGISLSYYLSNMNVNNNIITVNGSNHVAGIQATSTTNSKIKSNQITGNCTATSGTTMSLEAFAYGIVLSTELYQSEVCETYFNEIDDNTISLNSTIAYGIELNNADYNNITNNNVHTYGNVTMGLGIYNSSYNNITDNYFIITGETRTLNPYIYEAIYPVTTGIKLNETSTYNYIVGNHIYVVDTGSVEAYSAMFCSTGVNTIGGNYMTGLGTNPGQVRHGNAGIWSNCYIDIGNNVAYQ
ncbi:MAG: hypothetical protein IJJ47_07725 [Methanosphaera sp.]|nr:hypothetical protein [Methanosphaera sp.]